MSNYLAVATVTAAIGYVLRAASQVMEGAEITFERPDKLQNRTLPVELGINIYLYRTRTDPQFRNQDLPTRGPDGQLTELPTAALNLSYLLTFFGDDSKFEPQRLLGWTASTLHSHPILTSEDINGAIASYPALLTGSDLATQVQRVKLAPLELSLEDLSKVWSVFVAAPYLLSAAYEAGVVLVNPDEIPPMPGLPVRQRNLFLLSGSQPVITGIEPHSSPPGGTLIISGRHFGRSPVVVSFSGVEVGVTPQSPSRIACTLPSTLQAGVNSLSITTQLDTGTRVAPQLRQAATSNPVAFVIVPSITSIDYQAGPPPVIQVQAQPQIGVDQRVVLWLSEPGLPGGPGRLYGLQPTPMQALTGSLSFDASGVAGGTYAAQLSGDEALSVLSQQDQVVIP
ncbi:MAG TPA: DUF4255 domain-containing protein [Chloroflexota bacterium]